jgi:hypothetical protein
LFLNINLSKAATTVVFTALPGTSTAYLTQGSTGLVVFGFSMVVSGGSYTPTQFNIQTTTNVTPNTTNNVFTTGGPSATTSFLSQNTINSPSTAVTAGTHYAVQCNTNAISVTSGLPTYTAGTYYFYLVLAVAVNANSGLATTVSFNISSTTSPTVAQTMTGVTSVTPLTTSTTYSTGKIYNWIGGSTSSWGTAANWEDGAGHFNNAPGQNDVADIGVNFTPTQQPVIDGTYTIAQVNVGSYALNMFFNSGTTLNILAGLTLTNPFTTFLSVSATGTATRSVNMGPLSTITFVQPGASNNGGLNIASGITFTLQSSATGSATVGQIGTTALGKITGTVNVQRFITGGSGYRGYRLFGSPVNISSAIATTPAYMGLSYVNTTTSGNLGAFTGGPGAGYNLTMNNPSLYLYDETRASSTASYYSGRNVGVAAITGAPNYTISYLTTTGATVAGYQIPTGSAYLMYFIGNTTHTPVTNLVPESTTTTAIGTLNQGTIPVSFGTFGATLTTPTTAIPHTNNGYNQVGNPYASTINLDQVAADNATSINSIFYELSQPGGTYVAYHSDHTTSDARASQYIVSGQGFIIKYAGSPGTFSFKEDQKVAYPVNMTTTTGSTTTGTFLLDQPYNPSATVVPDAQTVPSLAVQNTPVISGLHLQITKDTANFTQTGIYFASGRTDAFKDGEDAIDLDGTAPVVYLSSYSTDGTRLSINELSDYTKGKRIKLYAKATSSGLYHISLNDIQGMDTVNYNVFLVDNFQKDSLDMVRYKTYAFNINTADTTTFGANRFLLAIEPHPMPPYQLVTFSGEKASEGVLLNWVTYNEGNFTGFVLQKLVGGKYVSLDSLQSTDVSKYSYTDINPITGSNTYRLKQSDFYGDITYSAPVTIIYGVTPGSGDFVIYPNPSKAMITINTGTLTPANTTPNYVYSIYNTSGLLVGQKTANSITWTEDLSNYKAGMYIIVLKDSNGKLIGKSKFIKTN